MTDDTTPTDEPSDDKIQSLERRVAELEAMTEVDSEDGGGLSLPDLLELGLTRRQALMAIALVGAGYALGPAITKSISEPAAASHGGATLGTPDNPLSEIYVHDLYNTTDNIAADSITTDDATITGRRIYIYDVSGDYVTNIDPSSTTTPVQDAVDRIGTNEAGAVYLPPGTIQEGGTLTGLGRKKIVGLAGPDGTRIDFQDSTTPDISVTQNSDIYRSHIKNVNFRGGGSRSAPFLLCDSRERNVVFDNCGWVGYDGDDIFRFNTGHLYASVLRDCSFQEYNSAVSADDLGAPFILCGATELGSTDSATPEFDLNDAGGFYLGHGWNKGRTACQLAYLPDGTTNNSHFIGRGNWEPSTAATVDNVIRTAGVSESMIHGPRVHGGNYTISNGEIEVEGATGGVKWIYANVGVHVSGDVTEPGSVIYSGASSGVDNQSGSTLTEYVTCLGDVVKKASTGSGYDGGTNDTRL